MEDYDFNYEELEDIQEFYNEADVDSPYIVNVENEEIYLFSNCKFFFDIYGGTTTLDLEDFYMINKKNIYKNIYKNLYIYKEPTEKLVEKLNIKIKNSYNFYNFIDYDNYVNNNFIKFNIAMNNNNIKYIKQLKKLYRLKYINEKN
jgi:hypothetical protein